MEFSWPVINNLIASYLWPFFRIAAMLMVMVVSGSNTTPVQVRLLLAVTITVAVAPMLGPVPDIELLSITAVMVSLQQVLIGTAMGLVTLMLVQTFVLTGQIIGMQTSLGFASMVDPASGQQTPVVSNFFLVLSILIFLLFNGHLTMMRMLITSFDTLPISTTGIAMSNYQALVMWAGYMFRMALMMALAAIVSLLLINLSFGVMTRAAPQLNIFAIGFPITMISGLLILWLTLSPVMAHFEQVWQSAQGLLCDMLYLNCRLDADYGR